MKHFIYISLLLPLTLLAQQDKTFVVKKPLTQVQKFTTGFYCSDYMTDGRACFYFDSTSTVRFFYTDKKVTEIKQDFAKNPTSVYSAKYSFANDTLRFVAITNMVRNDGASLKIKQTTTGIGHVVSDKIYFNIVSDLEGNSATKREVVVKFLR